MPGQRIRLCSLQMRARLGRLYLAHLMRRAAVRRGRRFAWVAHREGGAGAGALRAPWGAGQQEHGPPALHLLAGAAVTCRAAGGGNVCSQCFTSLSVSLSLPLPLVDLCL